MLLRRHLAVVTLTSCEQHINKRIRQAKLINIKVEFDLELIPNLTKKTVFCTLCLLKTLTTFALFTLMIFVAEY